MQDELDALTKYQVLPSWPCHVRFTIQGFAFQVFELSTISTAECHHGRTCKHQLVHSCGTIVTKSLTAQITWISWRALQSASRAFTHCCIQWHFICLHLMFANFLLHASGTSKLKQREALGLNPDSPEWVCSKPGCACAGTSAVIDSASCCVTAVELCSEHVAWDDISFYAGMNSSMFSTCFQSMPCVPPCDHNYYRQPCCKSFNVTSDICLAFKHSGLRNDLLYGTCCRRFS